MILSQSLKDFFNSDSKYTSEDKIVIIDVIKSISLLKTNSLISFSYIKLAGDIANEIEEFDIDVFETMVGEISRQLRNNFKKYTTVYGEDTVKNILYLHMVISSNPVVNFLLN